MRIEQKPAVRFAGIAGIAIIVTSCGWKEHPGSGDAHPSGRILTYNPPCATDVVVADQILRDQRAELEIYYFCAAGSNKLDHADIFAGNLEQVDRVRCSDTGFRGCRRRILKAWPKSRIDEAVMSEQS